MRLLPLAVAVLVVGGSAMTAISDEGMWLLNDPPREELKAKYGPVIEGGLQALDKALQINPDYDDAMAYENLLVRERADLADTKEEYEKQQKIADDWVQKALATKKRKAEAKNKTGGNIVLDPNQK